MAKKKTTRKRKSKRATVTEHDFSAIKPKVIHDIKIETCPFTIAIDTREQAPLDFGDINPGTFKRRDDGVILYVPTERVTMSTGDYSIVGYEDEITIERKELGDLYNCMGHDRTRFGKQVLRLSKYNYAVIMVESSWENMLKGYEHSRLNPYTIYNTVISWSQKHPNVHWHFWESKHKCSQVTFDILNRFWKERNDKSVLATRARELKKGLE